mmetsp:Transcript_24202/g.48961  ORF Transcript_24202/g.48961 Transcript_24202/m.48961 type:complete len:236 (+) Transcript_24202:1492-2199(+)
MEARQCSTDFFGEPIHLRGGWISRNQTGIAVYHPHHSGSPSKHNRVKKIPRPAHYYLGHVSCGWSNVPRCWKRHRSGSVGRQGIHVLRFAMDYLHLDSNDARFPLGACYHDTGTGCASAQFGSICLGNLDCKAPQPRFVLPGRFRHCDPHFCLQRVHRHPGLNLSFSVDLRCHRCVDCYSGAPRVYGELSFLLPPPLPGVPSHSAGYSAVACVGLPHQLPFIRISRHVHPRAHPF